MHARSITVHLRSMERAVSVEFTLLAGKYLRLGSAADVSLPMEELPAVACRMGYTNEGLLYVAEPDGGSPRELKLPGTLALGAFEFMAFPVEDISQATVPTLEKPPLAAASKGPAIAGHALPAAKSPRSMRSRRRAKKNPWPLVAAASVGMAVTASGVAAYLFLSSRSEVRKDTTTGTTPTANPATTAPPPSPAPADIPATAPPATKPVVKLTPEQISQADEAFWNDPQYTLLEKTAEDSEPMLELAEKLAAKYPDSLSALAAVAQCKTRLGWESEAEEIYKRCIERGGDTEKFWVSLGLVQMLQGKTDESRTSLRRTVELAPQDPLAWDFLTESYIAARDYAKAAEPLEQLRKVDPPKHEDWMVRLRAIPDPPPELRQLITSNDGPQPAPQEDRIGRLDKLMAEIRGETPSSSPPVSAAGRLSPMKVKAADDRYYADDEVETVLQLQKSKDWEGGRKLALKMVAKHPESPDALFVLASFERNLRLLEESEANFRRCIAMGGETVDYLLGLSQLQILQGKTADAAAGLVRATELAPEDPMSWFHLADFSIAAGNYADAAEPLKRLRDMSPEDFNGFMKDLRENKDPSAIRLVAELDGKAAPFAGGMSAEELAAANEATHADPDVQTLVALIKTKNAKVGLQLARKLVARYPKSTTMLKALGACQNSAEMRDEAEVSFRKMLSLDPTEPTALFCLAARYTETGRYADAAEMLEKLREVDKEGFDTCLVKMRAIRNPSAGLKLLIAKMEGKDTRPPSPTSKGALPKAAEKVAPYKGVMDDPLYEPMMKHMRAGDPKSALALAEKLAAKYPKDVMSYYALCTIQEALGMSKEAEANCRRCIAMEGDLPQFLVPLSVSLSSQNKVKDARASLKRAIEQDPEHASAWAQLALSYIGSGEYEKAEEPLVRLRKLDAEVFEKTMNGISDMTTRPVGLEQLIKKITPNDAGDNMVGKLAIQAGMPTGLLGVKWLMSVEEVRKIRPDIKLEKKTEYSETAEVYGKKALVVYNFSRESGSLILILVNIIGDVSEEEYEELHQKLVKDYGEMTPKPPEKDIIRSSIRVKGGFALEDKLKAVSGGRFLQIMIYMHGDP